MQVQNALWTGALQALKDWDHEVLLGKALLEARHNPEPCLLRLVPSPQSQIIVRMRWFLHNAENLQAQESSAANFVLCRAYLDESLREICEMLDWEFDLKAALAGQNCGPLEKRKLLVLTWVTQPFIDRRDWEGLKSSPFA